MNAEQEWQKVNADHFWGEIAPLDHVVQIYEDERTFLDTLTGFVGGGIKSNDCVVVIGTASHLEALDEKLTSLGVFVKSLIAEERYIPLDAEQFLASIMVNNFPSRKRFMSAVDGLVKRAAKHNRRVRAFGEMVAILWARGLKDASALLERYWNKVCGNGALCLFCAYPRTVFTEAAHPKIVDLCYRHSKMIKGTDNTAIDLHYRLLNGPISLA